MARSKRTSSSGRPSDGTAVSLPVVGDGADKRRIRPSRNAPRRAIVLTVVQLLIIAHIVQWLVTGTTTTPIEPSEAMEFSKYGVINAGLIFFVLVLLSTLIFGRWFCGWACHVVLLQDLCGWMMKKVGIRPKPFRSRLLMWVPLLLGLYMFVWPAFYRLAILPWLAQPEGGVRPWEMQMELTTSDFWATFPGLMVAIPFLLICGFATVYFLGSKGFCTYGCPYGGFFAPLDEYSPARIRVNESCEQSGHCTAVCSSNVRVHDEVREYGMVVDPGCMKCLDCVSVCPNDALHFGFGKTAAGKGEPKNEAPKRKYDLSMREEYAVAAVFAIVFFSFRGDYMHFPLLMAAGVAMVLTWIIWKAWRVSRDDNASLHRYQLKLRGAMKPAGWVMSTGAAAIVLIVVHSGAVNALTGLGSWHDSRVKASHQAVYWDEEFTADEPTLRSAQRGATFYAAALNLAGGEHAVSRQWHSGLHMRLAWLHSVSGDFDEAEQRLRTALRSAEGEAWMNLARSLGLILAAQAHKQEHALAWYQHVLVEEAVPVAGPMLDEFMFWADHRGQTDQAMNVLRARLERLPDDAHAMRWLALLLLDQGGAEQGIALLERAVELNPHDEAARDLLRMARQRSGVHRQ